MKSCYTALVVAAVVMMQVCSADESHQVISIWPAGTAQVDPTIPEEKMPRDFEVVKNIYNPNLTVFLPKKPNGTAVVICPGGAMALLPVGSKAIRSLKNSTSPG